MICEECKKCENFEVCENGCFGNEKPCEHLLLMDDEPKNELFPNYWGEY